jgi:hypothetical protein
VAHIPIDLPEQSVHIHAQRELAFEMISAIGEPNGGSAAGDVPVVLEQEGDRMLVQFKTPLKLGPISTMWATVEWVTPNVPSAINFELVSDSGIISGGLRELIDRFEFEEQGNCTVLRYKSRFGIRWSVGGWLLGKLLFGPIIKSHMIEHLAEIKEMVENRAKRSHIYPQHECSETSA